MKPLIGLVVLFLATFAVGCNYQPPPGGVEAYCWRIEAILPDSNDNTSMVFYTNIKPTEEAKIIRVTDAWLAWSQIGSGVETMSASRFDRHIGEMTLARDAFKSVTVWQTDWCPLDKR